MAELFFFHPRRSGLLPIRSTFNARHLRTVIDAIQDAWKEIETFEYVKSASFASAHWHDEDELTTKLAEILNFKLETQTGKPFSKLRFQNIVRDGKQSTGSLSSTSKMPDLTIRMMKRASGEDGDESALFVEAKLISKMSGCSQYVVEGMHRFVDGMYAPRTTFGLMLGYATATFSDPKIHLDGYFKTATSPLAVRCKSSVVVATEHPSAYMTTHSRLLPCPPTIRVFHVWVQRSVTPPAATSPVASSSSRQHG